MKLTVKHHDTVLDRPMTLAQAKRFGERNMPSDLRRHGFKCEIFTANCDDHGWDGYRINYGKRVAA